MDPNAPSSGDHAAASPTNTTVTLPPLTLRDVPRLPAAAAIPNPISRHPYFHPPATPSCGGFMPSQSTNAPESGSSGLSKVRLVGRMLNKVERVTDVAFTLDDGTGRIDVNRWENESSDTKEMSDVKGWRLCYCQWWSERFSREASCGCLLCAIIKVACVDS